MCDIPEPILLIAQEFIIPSAAARKTRFTECGAVPHESVGVPDYYCVYVRSMVGP